MLLVHGSAAAFSQYLPLVEPLVEWLFKSSWGRLGYRVQELEGALDGMLEEAEVKTPPTAILSRDHGIYAAN